MATFATFVHLGSGGHCTDRAGRAGIIYVRVWPVNLHGASPTDFPRVHRGQTPNCAHCSVLSWLRNCVLAWNLKGGQARGGCSSVICCHAASYFGALRSRLRGSKARPNCLFRDGYLSWFRCALSVASEYKDHQCRRSGTLPDRLLSSSRG